MSSAVNHMRRSHRSEIGKRGVYRNMSKRAYIRKTPIDRMSGIKERVAKAFARITRKREERDK